MARRRTGRTTFGAGMGTDRTTFRRMRPGTTLVLMGSVLALAACSRDGDKGVEIARIEGEAAPEASTGAAGVLTEAAPLPPPAPIGAAPAIQFPLMAAGSEPPWLAEIAADRIEIRRTGLRTVQTAIAPPRIEGQASVIVGAKNGAPFRLELFTQTCEGGEDGNVQTFPYTAKLTLDDFVFEGCAWNGSDALSNPAEAAEAPSPIGWARDLEGIASALAICAARASTQPAQVVYGRRNSDKSVFARVRDGSGERFDCLVAAGAAEAGSFAAVAPRDELSNEAEPVFTPPGGIPPRGRCNQTVEQTSPAGTKLGFLTFSQC